MARHTQPRDSKLGRSALAVVLAAGALTSIGSATAFAEPSAPTNGGNGAGQSGQCTGPASERPTACQSPGGVSQQ